MSERKNTHTSKYSSTYNLVDVLKKHNLMNKNLDQQGCLTLKTILKKDLDITMYDLPEERKISVINNMDLSFFGCMKKHKTDLSILY